MRPISLLASTTTTTFVIVTLLLVVAAVMSWVARWLIHRTRRDAPALGPLEVMGDRRWRRSDSDQRREVLTEARPPGALPPAPVLDVEPTDDDEPDEPDEPDEAETPTDPTLDGGGDVTAAEAIDVEELHRYDRPDG